MRYALIIVLAIAAWMSCSRQAPPQMSSQQIHWPPLTNFQCVVGRSATTNDIAAGRAAFVLQAKDGTAFGRPADIPLPQYAFFVDKANGRIPCVVIQAEEGNGQTMLGARTLRDGKEIVGLRRDFEFLGRTLPPT